jgi:hypothetical protein
VQPAAQAPAEPEHAGDALAALFAAAGLLAVQLPQKRAQRARESDEMSTNI